MEVRSLHPIFAAELLGADLAQEPAQLLIDTVEDAMREHAVLVVRDQAHIGDDEHIRFSRAFGPLELPPGFAMAGDPGAVRTRQMRFRPELYDASNLDETGEIAPADSLRHKFAKGNEIFHSDSSFNDLPTKWSLLLGHIVTPEKGETEFVDARAVYEALPHAMQERIEGRVAEHSFAHSRERGGATPAETQRIRSMMPPAQHPIVRVSASGRKSLYIGSHAYRILGMEDGEARLLIDELIAFASQPHFIYRHQWRRGDLVIWDNRCTLHRATEFDYLNYKRDLRRTTISESGEERCAIKPLETATTA
jgi:alpha-ketoglutarate-dependent 2,4-dichlorophenoxyacetate dioxygenase